MAPTAGYLAFAGIPLGLPFRHETGQIIITINPGYRDMAVAALNGAGAHVTVLG